MKVAKQNRVALVSAANAIFNLEGGWTWAAQKLGLWCSERETGNLASRASSHPSQLNTLLCVDTPAFWKFFVGEVWYLWSQNVCKKNKDQISIPQVVHRLKFYCITFV
jgi:hypothetical protein